MKTPPEAGSDIVRRVTRTLGVPVREPDELAVSLDLWYGAGDRYYHDLGHIAFMLDGLTRFVRSGRGGDIRDLATLVAATLFHDAIYDPARSDNEERSARLAEQAARTHFPGVDVARVMAMIRASAYHGGAEADRETSLFLDLDLSVLAAPEEQYRRYSTGIRREYEPHTGTSAFLDGRLAFLTRVLDTPALFSSDAFRPCETQARANLEAERQRLEQERDERRGA